MCWFAPLIIAGISAVSQMQAAGEESKAAARAANYNAKESERDATLAGMRTEDAIERGEAERDTYMRGFAQEQGSRAAAQGASGVVMGTGSNMDALADSAALANLDAETLRHNARVEAVGYKEQQRSALAQSELYKAEMLSAVNARKTEKKTALLNAAGSMAGASSSVASKG